jgi:hypothetical protein
MRLQNDVLRSATWAEVESLFQGKAWQAIVNARIWADRYGFAHEDYARLPVSLEGWETHRIAAALEAMSQVEPRVSVDIVDGTNNAKRPPRIDGLPIALIRFGERLGLLDGKHRAHRWASVPGRYAVLVVESAHR